MCDLIFEYGMPTVSWYAELAFRTTGQHVRDRVGH